MTLDDAQWDRVEGYRKALGVMYTSEALRAIIDDPKDFAAWVWAEWKKTAAGS